MMHITVPLPDQVAQQYYTASEKLATLLEGPAPSPQTLMRLMLASFDSDDVAGHFENIVRHIAGAPMPEETDTYVFSPEFDNVP